MKLHFTPAWLRRRIEEDADGECEAGPDIVETLDLLVRVVDLDHPDAPVAIISASVLRRILKEQV